MFPLLYFCLCCLAVAGVIYAVSKNFLLQKISPISLKGRHVFVTGGSKGIGKALAVKAAEEGANVTIVARNAADLEKSCEDLKKIADMNAVETGDGQRAQWFSADVTKEEEVKNAVELSEAEFGPIDVLINNAGGSTQAPFEELSADQFEKQMKLNYLSAIYATKLVVPQMKKRRSGRIAFVSSQAGQLGLFGYTAYSPVKFALRGLAEALQMELTPYNVRLTVAYPPNTLTEGFKVEQVEMPPETRKISETSGAFEPDKVAEIITEDICEGNYTSTIGLDGWLLGLGTCGMSPETKPEKVAIQALFGGIARFISIGYLRYFDWIVEKCAREFRGKKDSDEKDE